jgi:hypothetical protein
LLREIAVLSDRVSPFRTSRLNAAISPTKSADGVSILCAATSRPPLVRSSVEERSSGASMLLSFARSSAGSLVTRGVERYSTAACG